MFLSSLPAQLRLSVVPSYSVVSPAVGIGMPEHLPLWSHLGSGHFPADTGEGVCKVIMMSIHPWGEIFKHFHLFFERFFSC